VQAETVEYWRLLITAALAVLILVGAFVGSVIIQQRRYLAVTRSLSGRLILAQEQERSAVARELHDGLVQRVVMLGSELSRMPAAEPPLAGALAEWRDDFRGELLDVADGIRRVAHGMHPSILDNLGLAAALESLAEEFLASDGLAVRVTVPADLPPVPPNVSLTLYRAAQEGLRNVVRHARVRSAELCLTRTPEGLMLEIVNDAGAAPVAGAQQGLGLRSIAERARLLNGRFSFRSSEAEGTRLAVWVPLHG
jgi:two-component system sensor histidine kinase UhpB